MPEISRQRRQRREFLTDPRDQRTVLVCATMVGLALASLGIRTPSEDIDARNAALKAPKPTAVANQYCDSLPDPGMPLPTSGEAKPKRYMMPGVGCLVRVTATSNPSRQVDTLRSGEQFNALCLERDREVALRVSEQGSTGQQVTGDVILGGTSMSRFVDGPEAVPLCDLTAATPATPQTPAR
jgi:hypothetical protein